MEIVQRARGLLRGHPRAQIVIRVTFAQQAPHLPPRIFAARVATQLQVPPAARAVAQGPSQMVLVPPAARPALLAIFVPPLDPQPPPKVFAARVATQLQVPPAAQAAAQGPTLVAQVPPAARFALQAIIAPLGLRPPLKTFAARANTPLRVPQSARAVPRGAMQGQGPPLARAAPWVATVQLPPPPPPPAPVAPLGFYSLRAPWQRATLVG